MDEAPASPPPHALAGLPAAVVLAAVAALAGWREFARPVPVDEPAPAGTFSAERALSHLRLFALEPRTVGTEYHDIIRRWLTTEIRDQGLLPGLQAGALHGTSLSNVLVRLTGRESTGAVLFVCHYDSREGSPGAGDDGVSVAALLQLLEILPRAGPLRNDLIVLFSDGEEIGLLGAQLFASEHPWMDEVACVVNLEAMGNDGPLVMFETGPGSGALVEHYAAVAPHPVTTSLAPAVYRLLPRDTDFSVFRDRGLPGLNLAVVGGISVYHTPFDTPKNIHPGTVQLVGDTALALAHGLGNADLTDLQRHELTFYGLFGEHVVHYGRPVALGLSIAAILLLATAVLVSGSKDAGWRERALGALLHLVFVAASGFALYAAWLVVGWGVELAGPPAGEPRGNLQSTWWSLAGLATLALFLQTSVLELLRRHTRGEGRAVGFGLGGLALWILVVLALERAGPHAGAQLTPAAALAGLTTLLAGRRVRPLALLPGALLVVALLAPVVSLSTHLMSGAPRESAIVAAVLSPLVLALAAPFLAAVRHGLALRVILALGGVGLLAFGAWVRAQGL